MMRPPVTSVLLPDSALRRSSGRARWLICKVSSDLPAEDDVDHRQQYGDDRLLTSWGSNRASARIPTLSEKWSDQERHLFDDAGFVSLVVVFAGHYGIFGYQR